MIFSRPSSIQHLVTIKEKIENETISRDEVKDSYIALPFTIQYIIRQKIELITHQTINLDQAEKLILSENGVRGVANDFFHRELHKANRVFHIAITKIVEELTTSQTHKEQLQILKGKIDNRESNKTIQTFYQKSLSPELQGMIAGSMYNQCFYFKTFITNDMTINWVLFMFHQLPKEGLIAHPNSPFRVAVKELLGLYSQKT